MSDAPRIFFSYASEDGFWVEAFKKSTAFRSLGVVRILDYLAEEVGYGPLGAALDEQIHRSAVVVAFVSRDYCGKKWTVAEWEGTLTEAQRRRLIFVPLMLDADAIVWWQDRRREGKLSALSRDYAYVSFTDAGGRRLDIRPDDTLVNGKIARLARQIRQDIDSMKPPAGEGAGQPPSDQRPTLAQEADLVILGHPRAGLPAEMSEQISKLRERLGSRNVRFETWGDAWLRQDVARGRARVATGAMFIQPVAESEAADLAADEDAVGKYLNSIGFDGAKVVLWLPKAFSDTVFEAAAARSAHSKQFPALRVDSPQELANWLQSLKGRLPAGSGQPTAQDDGHLFLSFCGEDEEAAFSLLEDLEKRGAACWISTRDVAFNYQREIVDAIRTASAMLIVFSENANNSEEMAKEMTLARRYKIRTIPVRIEDAEKKGAFEYELSNSQNVDLFRMRGAAIDRILKLVGQKK
jgi:hypothetical protein